ncbi:hypothetical protein MNBD_GAMMA11-2115 [hydrothermal vent metagenome]|uniref:Uncharacterized protein n=1 Tax=hydrothermal vent metagenome TaxID=652676 RepID=A0A3B0XPL3_9ZZZZ
MINDNYLYTLISILILTGTTTSCGRVYYIEPDTESFASVSFSNLSPELPDIYIIDECKPVPVDYRLIEQKKLKQRSAHKTRIPAGKYITFKYEYNFLVNNRTQPVTSEGKLSSRIKIEKTNYASTCSSLVSFMPENNIHYEVYFTLLDTQCTIKASKSVISEKTGKKLLHSFPTTNSNSCKNR